MQLLKNHRTASRVDFGTMLPSYPSAMKQSSATRHPAGTSRVHFAIPPGSTSLVSILRKPASFHTSLAQQREHRRMSGMDAYVTSAASAESDVLIDRTN